MNSSRNFLYSIPVTAFRRQSPGCLSVKTNAFIFPETQPLHCRCFASVRFAPKRSRGQPKIDGRGTTAALGRRTFKDRGRRAEYRERTTGRSQHGTQPEKPQRPEKPKKSKRGKIVLSGDPGCVGFDFFDEPIEIPSSFQDIVDQA
jgi:hypothetical protein